jgi:hypothetical protein
MKDKIIKFMSDNGYQLSYGGNNYYWTQVMNGADRSGTIPPENEQKLLFFIDSLLGKDSFTR